MCLVEKNINNIQEIAIKIIFYLKMKKNWIINFHKVWKKVKLINNTINNN